MIDQTTVRLFRWRGGGDELNYGITKPGACQLCKCWLSVWSSIYTHFALCIHLATVKKWLPKLGSPAIKILSSARRFAYLTDDFSVVHVDIAQKERLFRSQSAFTKTSKSRNDTTVGLKQPFSSSQNRNLHCANKFAIMNNTTGSITPVTKGESATLEWGNEITTHDATRVDAAAVPTDDTIEQKESTTQGCNVNYPFHWIIFHSIVGLTVLQVFVYYIIVESRGYFQWTQYFFYYLLQALIPIQTAIIIACCNATDRTKLFVRPYFSTMAIWAHVNIMIGIFFVYWKRTAMLVTGFIGLASTLYHWWVVEKLCFKASETKETEDIEIAKAVDDTAENDTAESDIDDSGLNQAWLLFRLVQEGFYFERAIKKVLSIIPDFYETP